MWYVAQISDHILKAKKHVNGCWISRSTDAPPPILSLAGPRLPGAIYGKLGMQIVRCSMIEYDSLKLIQTKKKRINTFEFKKKTSSNTCDSATICGHLWMMHIALH